MINENQARKYCKDFTKIENYDKAVADETQTWHCHHRMELMKTGGVVDASRRDLIDWDIYYDRPPEDLIFLTKVEHRSLHYKGKTLSEETRKKISEAKEGHTTSEETRKKISEAMKGKSRSEETKAKISTSLKGKKHLMEKKHWKLVDGKRRWY